MLNKVIPSKIKKQPKYVRLLSIYRNFDLLDFYKFT